MLNGTMIQYFHWYVPADGTWWKKVKDDAAYLAGIGVNSVWLPPAYKGKEGPNASGYDVYDIYDLGEFDQKGSIRTKYGTKQEYKEAIAALHQHQIQAYADIVLNHKGGADEEERIFVRRVDEEDRTRFTSDPFEINAYTKFTFPGRKEKYSAFIWDHTCFSGVDYASDLNENGIFSICNEYGEGWEDVIGNEKGNYDYLMFADIEFRNPAVREELKKWGAWLLQETAIDGVRIDAVKHIPPGFYNEWLDHLRSIKPDLFAVGEYWAPGQLPLLLQYIDATEGRMMLFDAPLHHNFCNASKAGKDYDLRTIFNDSLVGVRPDLAVTLVDNHDTQPLQALEAPVESWFKPLAYAMILLRESGYPCIFYPDLYGASYVDKGGDGQDHEVILEKTAFLEQLMKARHAYAYGVQRDYIDHPNCIGWTREGIEEHPGSGCAVLLSNSEPGSKMMEIGTVHSGKTFIDFLGNHQAEVVVNESGWAEFYSPAGSVSVWVEKR